MKYAIKGKGKTSSRTRAVKERRMGYRVPRSFFWGRITKPKIRRAAMKIAEAAHPEKIILFGSFAYGKPTPDSDVDLFVIMESEQSVHTRMVELSKILSPRPFPVDILTRTSAELKARLEIGDGFFKEIMTKGKLLYERESS